MIPILYEKTETAFISNGIGRLSDCISCIVTEERNGLYECDFEYPISGINFDLIQVGRIIGVTHDESNDVEPFDIVSYSRPINGVVTFHCNHISYRLSYCTVTGSSISSLADTFTLFESAEPSMPFTFKTDKTSSGYLACADGTPRSVRQMMGGVEGSILDTYGGEYSYNNWNVYLYASRGVIRDFTIRYGVNMLDYNEDFDSQGTYSSCIPYWTDGENTVVGDRQNSSSSTITGRNECVPLDVSDKFEDQPTKAEVEAMGLSMLTSKNTSLPTQNIHVEFARLQDLGEYAQVHDLLRCGLCDTIKVVFPDYNVTGQFKIVKTVWNVLKDRYDSMDLGDRSTSLSEALGISNGLNNSSGGGGSASEYKKLLWTNPSPTSDFGTQSIALDASAYDELEIYYTDYKVHNDIMSVLRVSVGQNGSMNAFFGGTTYNSGVVYCVTRKFAVTSTYVSFENGNGSIPNNGWATRNDMCIPQKIYGIKYERVPPPQVEYPNYSTEEQQVGTWIDGKPIYRKVIIASIPSSGANFITAPSNIDTIIELRGIEKETGGAQAPIPKAHCSSFAYQLGIYYTGGNIVVERGSSLSVSTAYIICEYTKTTD